MALTLEEAPDALTPAEASRLLRRGLSTTYADIKAKRIPAARVGRMLLVPKQWVVQKLAVGETGRLTVWDTAGGGSLSPGHAQPSQARGQCDDSGSSLIWAAFASGCGLRDDAKPFGVVWDADGERCDEHAALTAASASPYRNRGAQRQSLLVFAAFAE